MNDSKVHPGAIYISAAIIIGFFGMTGALVSGAVRPSISTSVDGLLLGLFIGGGLYAFATVVAFWLGSSLGSKTKDVGPAALPLPSPVPIPIPAPVEVPEKPKLPVPVPVPSPVKQPPTPIPTPPIAVPSPVTKDLIGKMSVFGGPDDHGVSASEGLALCEPNEMDKFPGLFLAEQPPGTTGLARRLDPSSHYIACRWDYHETPKPFLQGIEVEVEAQTGAPIKARPIDWGPNANTGRVADLSPGLAKALGLKTDDYCKIIIPLPSIGAAQAGAPPPSGVHLRAMAQTQADLERVFGKFTYAEGSGGDIHIDQAWVVANIVSVDIPQLHKFTKGRPIECHRMVAPHLQAAFVDIEAKGLLPLILAYDGGWVPRHKGHDPSRGLSLHSWGAAIDINADWNPYGSAPTPLGAKGSTVALIPSFEAQGFSWGGYFNPPYQDAMHFEFARST